MEDTKEQARDVMACTEIDVPGFGRTHIGRDVADRIFAALAAAGLVIEQDWQTMETAPKEACTEWKAVLIDTPMGVDLGWWADAVESAPQQPSLSAGWFSVGGETFPGSPDYDEEPRNQPTHWRPKPSRPSAPLPAPARDAAVPATDQETRND